MSHGLERMAEDAKLAKLIENAKKHVMTDDERREQCISFAYGNAKIENPNITREMVAEAYDTASADPVCEICGSPATHFVRDLKEVDSAPGTWRDFEYADRETHRFCSAHARQSKTLR